MIKVTSCAIHPRLGTVFVLTVPTGSDAPEIVAGTVLSNGKLSWAVSKIEHWYDNCFGDTGEHSMNVVFEKSLNSPPEVDETLTKIS